jgi:hypothetical protein
VVLGEESGTRLKDILEYGLTLAGSSRGLGLRNGLYRRSHILVYLELFIMDGLVLVKTRVMNLDTVLSFGSCIGRRHGDMTDYFVQELGKHGHILIRLMAHTAKALNLVK